MGISYKYVGAGGDFDTVRPRRDFTCIITGCCLLSLLLLLPLLAWLLSGVGTTSLLFDCDDGFMMWETAWSQAQQDFCCSTMGRGCTTARPATALPEPPVTVPPTPPRTFPPPHPVPSGPVDPF